MEGLARWIHPTRGFIPPDEFVQLAEEAGLIHLLTLWAFDRAIRDLIVLRQQGYSGPFVNIADLFAKTSEKMQAILQKHDMAAEYIYLELTETGAMEDLEAGIAMLNSLANLGLKIAIDDFLGIHHCLICSACQPRKLNWTAPSSKISANVTAPQLL